MTNPIIYWKAKSKKSIGDYCPLPGDWVCTDKRVRLFRIWVMGKLDAEKKIIGRGRAHLYFKNGTEWMGKEFSIREKTMQKTNEKIISQATEYLNTLDK